MVSMKKDWNWFIDCIRKSELVPGGDHIEIRTVMIREPNWAHYATCLCVPSRFSGGEANQPTNMVYPQVALLSKEIPLQAIGSPEDIANAIVTWEAIDECPVIDLGQLKQDLFLTFRGSHNDFGDLPVWTFEASSQSAMGGTNEPLLHPSLPLYCNVVEAAADWLRDPFMLTNQHPTYTCRFLLTTSHAFIKDMGLDEDYRLNIKIEPLISIIDLVLKIAVKKADATMDRHTLPVTEEMKLEISPDAVELSVYLIDQNAELHDFFEETRYRTTWGRSVLNPQMAMSGRDWLGVIAQGEGMTTEFKEWVPADASHNKSHELIKAVVAFANMKGGTIFIGVDDNGEITGIQRELRKQYAQGSARDLTTMLQVYQRELRGMIRNSVAPDVNLEFKQYDSGGHIVLGVRVTGNRTSPYYVVQSNDVYIRRGASNRKPLPQEQKELSRDPR